MKNMKPLALWGLIILGGVGSAMAITNPSPVAYEEFAVLRLTEYLKQEVCSQAPTLLGNSLQAQCLAVVNSSQPQLKQIIARSTQQQNFLLFSIYKTELAVSPMLPSYHVETLAILRSFHIYKTEQR
jgi:hypothetical protein